MDEEADTAGDGENESGESAEKSGQIPEGKAEKGNLELSTD